jgi:CubicO group peptidase (beta-lactamase class C family)
MRVGLVIALWTSMACSRGAEEVFPDRDWERSTPEAQGVDSAPLAEMVESLLADNPGIHSVFLVRHGRAILDVSFYPCPPGTKHDIASCTKTVTAMTLGSILGQGNLVGSDTLLVDCFPGRTIAQLDDRKKSIRLRDVLTMRSGLGFFQQAISQLQMFQSPDWAQYCLNVKCWKEPGTTFEYFNGNPHLLSAAITQATQKPADQIARENIFRPIGIEDDAWPRDPQGISWGWGDLRLSSPSMARLGMLVLHHGQWNGAEILPKAWIEEMTTPHVAETGNKRFPRYGYQVWLADDRIAFNGRGGQRIWIVPKEDLVFVTTAGASRAKQHVIDDLLTQFVLPATHDAALADNPEATARLMQLAQRALQSPTPQPTLERSDLAKAIDGTRFDMTPNPYASSIRISFPSRDEARLELELPKIHRSPNLDLRVGLDGVPRYTPARHGELAALTGKWTGNVFEIDFDELANINHWKMKLTFESADRLKLDMTEGTELPPVRAKGTARQESPSPSSAE